MFDSKKKLSKLPSYPGVYQFLDSADHVLYVGKARNLKKRVASYFRPQQRDAKTQAMMQLVNDIKVIISNSENDALLLESQLIKQLKPRYNILLRDDKSYPYLYLSAHKDFPRLDFHRGAKSGAGRYFGPYPSAGAVRETLNLLQKLFKLRQCRDTFFKYRTRPCLQYQIKRCTAPCVAYVDKETYQENVRHAVLFLEGKNTQVVEEIAAKMDCAAKRLDYEEAALYRDQIVSLRRVQRGQQMNKVGHDADVDIVAVIGQRGTICMQVLYIRGGRFIGQKSYFPAVPANTHEQDALAAFLPQYYLSPHRGNIIPSLVIVNVKLPELKWIQAALAEKLQQKLIISDQARGDRRHWLKMAITNAQHMLAVRVSEQSSMNTRFDALQTALKLANPPQRLECFDISHTTGEATVASCVVFDREGIQKKDYRHFNLRDLTAGDDYAAMDQALTRRYKRLKEEDGILPDVLIIDGGKGQLGCAEKALEEQQVSGVVLLAIAKGASRKPGLEKIYISGREKPLQFEPDGQAFHLLQQIRDEAHRFAIMGHRERRAKARRKSMLEDIPGIGVKRRQQLLRQFGGLHELKRVSIDDLAQVPGISKTLAQQIFVALHK